MYINLTPLRENWPPFSPPPHKELTCRWGYGILLRMNNATGRAAALAHPNIAFIKYWGMADESRKIPANASLSMNLGCLSTRTMVTLDPDLSEDALVLNGRMITGPGRERVHRFMDHIRRMAGKNIPVQVVSENNFPVGTGLASSASAFAALALAGTTAFDLELDEKALSQLARFGSGSASRSVPGGFVEWRPGEDSVEPYAESIAPPDHWKLFDCIAILSAEHKPIGSEAGMRLADTSPFQAPRVQDSHRRLGSCRQAILNRDFEALARVVELDSNMMHAVMMTSQPPLFYWQPESLAIMKAVKDWQARGLPVTYTLDAGPNVHVLCTQEALSQVLKNLREMPGVLDVLKGLPAGPARLITPPIQS